MMARPAVGCLFALGLAVTLGPGGSVRAQTPPAPAPTPLTPEMQKQKDLRGPSMSESELSTLTPEAREKTDFVDVKEAEVSPFSMVAKLIDEFAPARPTATEEQKIRRVLSGMRVSGLAGSSDRRRVLIGSMTAAEGDPLPPLFYNQAEQLKVFSISERAVVLEFIEKQREGEPRRIELPFDLSARVDSLLPGEAFVKIVPVDGDGGVKLPPKMLEPVKAALKATQNQDLQSMVDRPIELLNAPAVLQTDEQKKP